MNALKTYIKQSIVKPKIEVDFDKKSFCDDIFSSVIVKYNIILYNDAVFKGLFKLL